MQFFIDREEFEREMLRLIEECDTMFFATAWATSHHDIFKLILQHRAKIRKAIIGLNFYQTDPNVLDEFISDDAVHFIMQKSGIFHPKLYLFITGQVWTILIGSANLTKAAFKSNQECLLCVSSGIAGRNQNIYEDILGAITRWWEQGNSMTSEQAADYRKKWQPLQKNQRELARQKTRESQDIPFFQLIWDEFFIRVQKGKTHNVVNRCNILSYANEWFRQYGTLANMPDENRKLIAGTKKWYNDLEFWWFGNMSRGSFFPNLIKNSPEKISNALDHIPFNGPVTIANYRNYYHGFEAAFPNGKGSGLAVMSRLLAMKRPDYFICLNEGNKKHICTELGVNELKTHENERYWTDIVENIISSVWWKATPPQQELERKVWEGRAALLDAIFYEPVQ